MGGAPEVFGENIAEIAVELQKSEDRVGGGTIEALSAPKLAKRWRELMRPVPGAKRLSFRANAAGQAGRPIDVQISGTNFEQLQSVSRQLKEKLSSYEGLYDIRDNYSSGKREIQLKIKPSAQALGLRMSDLGKQVRAAFYGTEAQRIQRGRDDIKVMVRYSKSTRASTESLEQLRIHTPTGQTVPFSEVAEIEISEGFSTIQRVDRRRVINITADANKDVADLELIKSELQGETGRKGFLDELVEENPGILWSFEGEAREQADTYASLTRMTIVAIFIIYALLAIPLKSYLQPFIVMSVIPYGLIGAIGGHMLMGRPMSILSILGFVALAGVVVNDSLVLVDYINQERKKGVPLRKAIEDAGAMRFRPIILTSVTTFCGLLPLLFETSLQAQFLIPMAISLSFGVLFATLMTLILVPGFYSILQDITEGFSSLLKKAGRHNRTE